MTKSEAIIIIATLRQALEKLNEAAGEVEKVKDQLQRESLKKTIANTIATIIADAICPIEGLYPELDPYRED